MRSKTLFVSLSRFLLFACFAFIIWGGASHIVYGQNTPTYCTNGSINQIAWSPDGEQLAVSTRQGIHFYDRELALIKSIPAPVNGRPRGALVWSPDGQWLIAPQPSLEALDYLSSNPVWSIINIETGEADLMTAMVGRPMWSPDNQYIASLYYEDPLGLASPYSAIFVRSGISDTAIAIRSQEFQDVELTNLQWTEDNILTAQLDGLVLSFDIETLEPTAADPYFYPSWWVPSLDGTREAAYYETFLYVREHEQEEQRVLISDYLLSDGDPAAIGQIAEIHWMSDNQHLIGMYPRRFSLRDDAPQDLPRILQGTVVDAINATEINHFLIVTDTDITGYAVSRSGDRLAILRDYTRIEVWHPLTNDLVASVDVPFIEIEGYCD